MNEWFKRLPGTIKEKWGKWTPLQKGVLVGIIAVAIAAVVILAVLSSKPTTVRLFNTAITDEQERDRILTRLDQDNVKAYVSNEGFISVDDEKTARKWRSRLIADGLEPSKADAYALFDVTKWTRNDFDDKVNWQRATTSALEDHLQQLSGIQKAKVMLSLPDDSLFKEDQQPVTASVVLWANGGSSVLEDKRQIKGIQRLIMRSVEGLKEENITIVDGSTNEEINDFEGMEAAERLTLLQKEQKLIRKQETEYSSAILNQLKGTYGVDRVNIANMKIEMDMSERTAQGRNYKGIEIKADNPDTPYDDGETRDSLTISEETINRKFTGTGFNPEGPAGTEGQNPPVYSDMSNVIGQTTEDGIKRNYALSYEDYQEKTSPSMGKRTVSVNIDGTWSKVYDEKGNLVIENGHIQREYKPIPDEDLKQIERLVQGAIGYSKARGDSVTVTNIAFDRTAQFDAEDMAFLKSQQTKRTILLVLLGVAAVLIAFIVFRLVSREIERRRRLREEELLRKQQAEREQALWDAKQDGMEVTMSVEERRRAELQENAIAMAKEHPEDVAMLIRTWLREEA